MACNFNKHAQKGNEFVSEVARELGIPEDKDKALRILKAVLHTLRDKITPEESLQLIAQLPLFIKAIYVDGWRISGKHEKMRQKNDFLEAVISNGGVAGNDDFQTLDIAESAVRDVFHILQQHVSEGEIIDVIKILPIDLRQLWA